jgi:hypothetical protein
VKAFELYDLTGWPSTLVKPGSRASSLLFSMNPDDAQGLLVSYVDYPLESPLFKSNLKSTVQI